MSARYFNRCRRSAGLTLLAFGLLALAACSSELPSGGEMSVGQEQYLRWCASCHGNQGEGRPPAFPPLAGSEWLDLPEDGLAMIVLYGLRGEIQVMGQTYRGYMPPMQHLSDADIADIIGFMLAAWTGHDPGLEASRVAELRNAFPGRRPPLEGLHGLLEALEAIGPR